MFLDEAEIEVESGTGGDGVVHFRREKYVPRGGPDGGDGGKGGDIVLHVDPKLSTLSRFRRKRHYHAQTGGRGGPNNRTGKNGEDTIIKVPPGTLVYDAINGRLLRDLVDSDETFVVCKGGRGGRGNSRFSSSRNRAPRMAERGEPGESQSLKLELRLLADVGIVGMPNAGKSTLLAAVSNAKPKIAPYPFTTLEPNLGVVWMNGEFVMADIPGLIEGAHMGIGLGSTFLRHITRTRVLIHLVDGTSADPIADFSQVNTELALFDATLEAKRQILVINKLDLEETKEKWPLLQERFKELGHTAIGISALAHLELQPLLKQVHAVLQTEKARFPEVPEQTQIAEHDLAVDEFHVEREEDGTWRLSGRAIERAAAMTYWEYEEAVRRFHRILEHLGVDAVLRDSGIEDGDTVRIGEKELEWQE